MQWSATNKGLDFPYICQSNCAVGYVWRIATRKCVRAVRLYVTGLVTEWEQIHETSNCEDYNFVK